MRVASRQAVADQPSCGGHRPALRFRFASADGEVTRCLRHAAASKRVLVTAVITALLVGTVLTAINQGNLILDGRFVAALIWKVPLTYFVPYCVSTFAALRVSYTRDR